MKRTAIFPLGVLSLASLLLGCQEETVISRVGCEFGDNEAVVLSEFVEPVLGMPFPPGRYIEALAQAHPLSIFRDETPFGSHSVATPDAEAAELVIADFGEMAMLQHWGPSSGFPNEPPCRYEQLNVVATLSIRRPSDGLVLVGPGTIELGLSVDEIDGAVLEGPTVVAAQWLEELEAPAMLPEYQVSSGFSWDDEEDPSSPMGFKGSVKGTDDAGDLVAIAEFISASD